LARDRSIDALRGLAIFLVVAGHAIPLAAAVSHAGAGLVPLDAGLWTPAAAVGGVPYTLIYSFHMPLFAFISGYVMRPAREDPLGAQILRRVQTLLVPFFAWALLRYVVPFGGQGAAPSGLGGAMVDALLGRDGLWFLYALFICTVIVICLGRLPISRWVLPASAVVAALCAFNFRIPEVFNLPNVLWIYPFVVLGTVIAPLRTAVLGHKWRVVSVGLAAFAVLFLLGDLPGSIRSTALGHVSEAATALLARVPGWSVVGGLVPYACASAAVFALYGLYAGRSGRTIDIQARLGRLSLGVYAMHATVIRLLVRIGVSNVLLLIMLSLAIAAALTALLERIPVLSTVFLGRPFVRRTDPGDDVGSGESVLVPAGEMVADRIQ
jgi:fucose 4-O-acetylase-like acetyltransferase